MKSLKISFMLVFFAVLFSCKKKDAAPALPTVTTAAITEVTPSTAKGGGNITANGGRIIVASGLCYSKTNQVPTVGDDTTRTAVLTGSFTSMLDDLSSGSTYYVRAYATNEVGTGYGEVRSFTTGNAAPVASNVTITGEIKGDVEVTVTYTYFDKEGDAESGTTIQWYRADNSAGQNTVAIPDATTNKYRISSEDENKILWVGITPKTTTGTPAGAEAISEKKGPVGAATTVTFMYNGQEVTYGIINSSKTSRQWLDRNLGAPAAPVAYNDYANLGDLFQWGRPADGHQLVKRNLDPGTTLSGTSEALDPATTTTLSPTDVPADSKFIRTSGPDYDWRATINNNLWQGVDGINNPCPEGWRVPTIDEWTAEQFGNSSATNFTQLKLTHSGTRYTDGSIGSTNGSGYYWSSTTSFPGGFTRAVQFTFDEDSTPGLNNGSRGEGAACRCIKN